MNRADIEHAIRKALQRADIDATVKFIGDRITINTERAARVKNIFSQVNTVRLVREAHYPADEDDPESWTLVYLIE